MKQLQTIQNPLQDYKISPEIFEVATTYVKTLDLETTARTLDLPVDVVSGILDKKEVKRYVDQIFLQEGYMQRNKLNDVMTKIIDLKVEEMDESEMGSNKDILEIMKLAHQMQMDHNKAAKEASAPSVQNNFQQNVHGDNYSNLMAKIISGEKL